MQSKPPSSYRSGSSLPVQNATGRRDINDQRKHQPSKRVPNSADESASLVPSFAVGPPTTSASVETRGAIELGINHLPNSQNITLETFKELNKENKDQLVKIWTTQFMESKQLPTTKHGLLSIDLNSLNTQDYNVFFKMLKANNNIVHLQLYNCQNLNNLEALQLLTNLQSLYLTGCQKINDLEPLKFLKNLQLLNLQGCQKLTNLEPLKFLKNLQLLTLNGCQKLNDLEALQPLTNLQSLYLTGCQKINDLKALKCLKKLQSLTVQGCQKLTNLEPLKSLRKLQSLTLQGCQNLTNLEPLTSLTNLQSLYLQGCQKLTDLEALKFLTNLQLLTLTGCQKLTFPQINLPKLKTLKLSDSIINNLNQVDIKKQFPNLEELKLAAQFNIFIPKSLILMIIDHENIKSLTLNNPFKTNQLLTQFLVRFALKLKQDPELSNRPLFNKFKTIIKNLKLPKNDSELAFYFYSLHIFMRIAKDCNDLELFKQLKEKLIGSVKPDSSKEGQFNIKKDQPLSLLSLQLYSLKYCLKDVDNAQLTDAFICYISQDEWVNHFISKLNVANIKTESYATISQYLFILSDIKNDKLSKTKRDLKKVLETEKVKSSHLQKTLEPYLKKAIKQYYDDLNKGESIDEKDILFDDFYYELWPLDIAIESKKLCIELDGRHHSDNPFQRQNDAIRDMELSKQEWRVVRIRNSELTQCLNGKKINQDLLDKLIESKLTSPEIKKKQQ